MNKLDHSPANPVFVGWINRHARNATPAFPARTPLGIQQGKHLTDRNRSLSAAAPIHANEAIPSDEALRVAALKNLAQRLHCKNPFVNAFLSQLQQDPIATSAWLDPLPRPLAGHSAVATAASAPFPPEAWVAPIHDIVRSATWAMRQSAVQEHERDLVFAAAVVKPLLMGGPFGFELDADVLQLRQRINKACSSCGDAWDEMVRTDATSGDMPWELAPDSESLLSQAALLKAVLIPQAIHTQADGLDHRQFLRVFLAVDAAKPALLKAWHWPQPVTSETTGCPAPARKRKSGKPQCSRGDEAGGNSHVR